MIQDPLVRVLNTGIAVVEFPQDLQAIPTQPWDERPSDLPLRVEECRTALWIEQGNVAKAAARLKVTAHRLRRFIQNSPRLLAEQNEAREQLADRAEEVVKEALFDPVDAGRRDGMAKYVLSSIGRTRGFGQGPGKQVNINSQGGNILIQWADGSQVSNEQDTGVTIDGEAEESDAA